MIQIKSPPSVDENKIKNAAKVLKNWNDIQMARAKKKPLLDDLGPTTVFLVVCLKKIPRQKNVKMIKVSLPHSLVTSTTEVCLFTGDLDKRDRKAEIEPTILHYKDVLRSQGIQGSIEVIPLRQLRTDYKTAEAKRKLVAAYDVFLADKTIAQCLPKCLGKFFFEKRKFPQQLKMGTSNLKEQIEKALSKTILFLTGRGNSCIMEVAHLDWPKKKITENVMAAVETLRQMLPGSFPNIKALYLKTYRSISLPLYISFESGNNVHLPNYQPPPKLHIDYHYDYDDVEEEMADKDCESQPKVEDESGDLEEENDNDDSAAEDNDGNASVDDDSTADDDGSEEDDDSEEENDDSTEDEDDSEKEEDDSEENDDTAEEIEVEPVSKQRRLQKMKSAENFKENKAGSTKLIKIASKKDMKKMNEHIKNEEVEPHGRSTQKQMRKRKDSGNFVLEDSDREGNMEILPVVGVRKQRKRKASENFQQEDVKASKNTVQNQLMLKKKRIEPVAGGKVEAKVSGGLRKQKVVNGGSKAGNDLQKRDTEEMITNAMVRGSQRAERAKKTGKNKLVMNEKLVEDLSGDCTEVTRKIKGHKKEAKEAQMQNSVVIRKDTQIETEEGVCPKRLLKNKVGMTPGKLQKRSHKELMRRSMIAPMAVRTKTRRNKSLG